MKLGLHCWIAALVSSTLSHRFILSLKAVSPLPVENVSVITSHPILDHHFSEKQSHLSFPQLFTLWVVVISPVCIVQGCLLSCLSPHMWSPSTSLTVLCLLTMCTLHFPSPSRVGHWCMNKPPPLLPEALHFSPLPVTPSVSIYHHFPTCLTSVTEPFFFVANWEFHYQCQTY